jgi:hypothetical protein
VDDDRSYVFTLRRSSETEDDRGRTRRMVVLTCWMVARREAERRGRRDLRGCQSVSLRSGGSEDEDNWSRDLLGEITVPNGSLTAESNFGAHAGVSLVCVI